MTVKAIGAAVLTALATGAVAAYIEIGESVPTEEMAVRTVGPGGGGYLYSMGLSSDPNRLYVGCDVGGFYRSDDLGRSYRILNAGVPNVRMFAIAEHPADPDTILVASKGGAAITRDGGLHWKCMRSVAKGVVKPSLYDSTWPIRAVAWSRANPRRAWIGAGGWNVRWRVTKDEARVWRSDDGCESCEMILPEDSPLLKEKEIFCFSPHPTNQDEVLCTTAGGIYLSTDGGVHWTKQTKGLPDDPRMWARWVNHSRSNPSVVYASFVQWKGEFDVKNPHQSGVWKSTDGGRSWTKCGAPQQNPRAGESVCWFWNEACVFVDPRDENVVWVSGLCFFRPSVWKSVDGGKTWSQSFKGPTQGWLHFWGAGTPRGMALSPSNPDVVAYGNSGTVYVTEDGGKTWNQRYTGSQDKKYCCGRGLEVTCLSGLVPDRAVKDRWYLPYMDLGLMISQDSGKTLYRSTAGIPKENIWDGTCFSLVQSPDDPKLLWSTWGRWGDMGKLKAGGIFAISRDAGENWNVTTNGGWTIGTWPHLAHLKGKAGNDVLFAVNKLVQRSTDGGAHWEMCPFPYPQRAVSVAANGSEVFIGTDHNEHPQKGYNGSLWRSRDEGRTWENITAAVTNRIADVGSIAFYKDMIVFSSNHPHMAKRGGGVFVSRDGGKSWRKSIGLLAATKVCFFRKEPTSNAPRLVVACQRRDRHDPTVECGGVYVSDDFGESWRRLVAPGFDRPSAKYAVQDPFRPDDIWVGTGGNSVFVLSPKKDSR